MTRKKEITPQESHDFSVDFVAHCTERSSAIVETLDEWLTKCRPDLALTEDQKTAMKFHLVDELTFFFHGTIRMYTASETGTRYLTSIGARIAGEKSGVNRKKSSVKEKFLDFAVEQNRRNRKLSKNQLAEMYAKEHPETSIATLRRYLSELPIRWVREDGSTVD